jgi:hypothetical protein
MPHQNKFTWLVFMTSSAFMWFANAFSMMSDLHKQVLDWSPFLAGLLTGIIIVIHFVPIVIIVVIYNSLIQQDQSTQF